MKNTILPLILLFIALRCDAGWVQQTSGTNANLHSVVSSHGQVNTAWICGDNGTILFTSNGGAVWTLQNSGTVKNLYAICFMELSGGPVFAVGQDGIILRTTNDGTNWMMVPSPTSKTIRDISDFNFIAVGDSGLIIKSTNQGLNWSVSSNPVSQNLNAVCATFGYYAVGDNGTILKSFNAGLNWQPLNSGTIQHIYGVPLFGSIDIAVGDNGLILRSTSSGNNWFSQPSGFSGRLKSVEYSVNNTSRIYTCGADGKIMKTTNYGNVWGTQNTPTSEDLNSVFFYLDDNTGYACGNGGVILKTTDGGGSVTYSLGTRNLVPESASLEQNYPNPFNPMTWINFSVSEKAFVQLKVFDIAGREVTTLVNGIREPGKYSLSFDASALPSGVYFCKLTADSYSSIKKMIMIK